MLSYLINKGITLHTVTTDTQERMISNKQLLILTESVPCGVCDQWPAVQLPRSTQAQPGPHEWPQLCSAPLSRSAAAVAEH